MMKTRWVWAPDGSLVLWPSGEGYAVLNYVENEDFVADGSREVRLHWVLELLLKYGPSTSSRLAELKGYDLQYASHECGKLYRAGKVERETVVGSRFYLYRVKE